MGSRGASARRRSSVASRSRSISGHGASGFTWSIVIGETPPQSFSPAVRGAGGGPRGPRGPARLLGRARGGLAGGAVMRPALRGEPLRDRLEHDPLRGRDPAQERELARRHDARVRVRQETRLVEDEAAHRREVLDRRLVAEGGELLARGAVAELGLVAEREERLVAARLGAGGRNGEHLVGCHVGTLAPAWGAGEGGGGGGGPGGRR